MTHIAFENVKEIPIDLTEAVDQIAPDTFLLAWEILADECSGLLKWNDCSCVGIAFQRAVQVGLGNAAHGSHTLSHGGECNPSRVMSSEQDRGRRSKYQENGWLDA
jgi:hypothetical protein